MSDVFTLRARLAAPPEAVYRALTELKRMHELGAAWHRIEFELPQ